MEVTEVAAKQVRRQKSAIFKLKAQIPEVITSVVAGELKIFFHINMTRVLAFLWYQSFFSISRLSLVMVINMVVCFSGAFFFVFVLVHNG